MVLLPGCVCCSPLDPPEEQCYCGDNCSYIVELVSPSELPAKTPEFDCNFGGGEDIQVISPSLLQLIVPVNPSSYNESTCSVLNAGGLLIGDAGDFLQGEPEFLPPEGYVELFFEAFREIAFRITCAYDDGTVVPKFSALISVSAEARFFGLGGNYNPQNIYSRGYIATLNVPATCAISPDKECVPSEQNVLRINTPLEITINGDGTSSLGSLGAAIENIPLGGFSQAVKDAVDAILAATNYTFRITATESCEYVIAP